MIYVNHRDHRDNNVTEEARNIDQAFQLAKDILKDGVSKEVFVITNQFRFKITDSLNKILIGGLKTSKK